MLLRAPRHLPSLEMMLADLPIPQVDLARHLGVTDRALRRWKSTGTAPRAILLALYWETRWGRSTADVDAFNTAQMYKQKSDGQELEVQSLKREVQRLAAAMHDMDTLDGEAVNSPAFYRA